VLRKHIRSGSHLQYVLLQLTKLLGGYGPRDFAWQRAECLSQLGLVLIDYSLFDRGRECLVEAYRLKGRLVKRTSSVSRYPSDDNQELARERRRLAWALSGTERSHRELWDR